jgi:hypothetical protein
VTVTGRGSTDEAVVVVKLRADEDAVTYLRAKLSASGTRKSAGGEGRNTLMTKYHGNVKLEVRKGKSPTIDSYQSVSWIDQ